MESFRIGRTISRTFTTAKNTLASVGIFVLVIQVIKVGSQMIAQPRLLEALQGG